MDVRVTGEVPRKTCLMDRWWRHSLRWGTMAEDLRLEVKNHKSSFRHIEFEVLLRMYMQLSKIYRGL